MLPHPVPPAPGGDPAALGGFVGRARELAELRAAFADTAAGASRLMLVTGPPGIGKTELIRTFAQLARADGALVLQGSAWEDAGAPPYWPWVQVLRGYHRRTGASGPAGDTGLLGQLMPELGAAREPDGSGEGARFALFEAVGAILDQAAAVAPLVVILEDVHAAGRPSVLLLRFAASTPLSRILLIASYREAEAHLDAGISDVIAALESAGQQLSLDGLPPAEIQAMLPGASAEVLAAVSRRSAGNPLFISQVARLLGHGAATVDEVPVPAGIRQAIRGQLARLGETPAGHHPAGAPDRITEIMATAAALGPAFDASLVAAALDMPADPVARLLDRATAAGLLQAGTGPGQEYRFAHALIRETMYAELPPRARAETHYQIAAVLDTEAWQGRTGHADLAYHYLQAAAASSQAAARAVDFACLAGEDALGVLAYEEAAAHFQQALDALSQAPQSAPDRRCGLLLRLGTALTKSGPNPGATRVIDEAARLARQIAQPRLLAAAALLTAQYLDFNAPAEATIALLREAAETLPPGDLVLRARVLGRLAVALAPAPAARAAADEAVQAARAAVSQATPTTRNSSAAALASALTARHHVLWGSQDPATALAGATEIVVAAQQAQEPDAELDGRVLRLTHLLELGDGPGAQRVLPELDRLAGRMRQPVSRLVALSRRSTLAALTGDFPAAADCARQAWQAGQAAGLPDAPSVYWGQLFAIWIHAGLPAGDEEWMEQELRGLVARSQLSVAHAAALVQVEAAKGAEQEARGRLDELIVSGMDSMHPDMLYVWGLAQLAQSCCLLQMTRHAERVYRALTPYTGRAAVAAGAVHCAGSTDFYLGGLAALAGRTELAGQHYRLAISCHRRLGARPMLAHSLHRCASLLRQQGSQEELATASAMSTEARSIAADCGMTKLPADGALPASRPADSLSLTRDGDYWLIGYAGPVIRLPDSLGLRYLDLLLRNPGRELPAFDMVQLAGAPGAAGRPAAVPGTALAAAAESGLQPVTADRGEEILDAQARAAYQRRLAELDEELAEAERWHDTERASRLRADQDFLVHELTAATGLGQRPRRLGSEAERARVNVTRAIRSAVSRIRDRDPAAAEYLDRTVRTGTRCSYAPPAG